MKMKRNTTLLSFGLGVGLWLTVSCTSDPSDIGSLREVCFDAEVLPIFQTGCAVSGCHDATAADGYRLDSYASIMKGIQPFDAFASTIYRPIISTGEDRMPPEVPLTLEERMLIRVWIDQGAARTVCGDSVPTDTTGGNPWSNPHVCFERDILPVMQSSCGITGCHDPFTMVEEYNFTTYAGILEGLNPGNPNSSKIYESITEDEPSDIMPPPPYDPLTQAQIDSIYNWILAGAPNEPCGESCDTVSVTFNTHLEPLMVASCKGCHSGTSPQGGVRLESYNDLVASVNSGAVPAVLTASSGYSLMPPYGQLSECEIRTFEIWIENGMPN
jgi:hypothetical protein